MEVEWAKDEVVIERGGMRGGGWKYRNDVNGVSIVRFKEVDHSDTLPPIAVGTSWDDLNRDAN